MAIRWIKILLFTIIVIVLQVWLFDNIKLFKVATPYVCPILLMFLPINLSKVKSILYAFIVGMIIDNLTFTPGLHTVSLTFLGFIRPYILVQFIDEETIGTKSAIWSSLKRGSLILLLELLIINTFMLLLLDSLKIFNFQYFIIRLSSSIALSYVISLIILYVFDMNNSKE